ncbi:Protein CBG02810 [Caenorhabditis briggsae]|uniref:Protein CBG02810 n=1 Tax=Caenorhabditis briggsae TaxID=6238 RepID=A8WTG6_CAEBR|nr:Protein CBG02810 [Caenorhabditis briggsae]CAP23778.1 Protein CBG02810 [Caenorhabditis briggsae]
MADAEAAATHPDHGQTIPAAKSIPDGGKLVDPVDKYTALAVRGAIVGVGLAGGIIYLRNSKLFHKFQHVNQIPKDFIRKELELKGRVREVLPSGELRVEHEPIMKIPFLPKRKNVNTGLLNLRLAGVELSQSGQQFLAKDLRLTNKPVTFTVIKEVEGAPDVVDADVTVKRTAFGRTNLNVEVVRRGYARVPGPEQVKHLKSLQSVPAYSRLISRLLMSEKVADRRGVGVWERDTWVESVQSYPSQVSGIIRSAAITKAVVLLYNVTKDVILYGVKLTQQTYYMVLAIAAHLQNGYRRFASGVDRLTDKYNKVRQRIGPK